MYARVTQYKIHPGKLDQFTATVDSLMPAIHQLAGFRLVLVLRGTARDKPDALIVSVWDSIENLHASDNNVFLNQALARLMSCCEAFPTIREQEVLLSEFATP
jgi:heme-degrading monooxygenase HmoA